MLLLNRVKEEKEVREPMITTFLFLSSMIFSSFRSRCTIPWECMYSTPCTICRQNTRASASGSLSLMRFIIIITTTTTHSQLLCRSSVYLGKRRSSSSGGWWSFTYLVTAYSYSSPPSMYWMTMYSFCGAGAGKK